MFVHYLCYTVKNSLEIVHQFQSMNKRNKVELNKVKKDMPFSAILTLLDFIFC